MEKFIQEQETQESKENGIRIITFTLFSSLPQD